MNIKIEHPPVLSSDQPHACCCLAAGFISMTQPVSHPSTGPTVFQSLGKELIITVLALAARCLFGQAVANFSREATSESQSSATFPERNNRKSKFQPQQFVPANDRAPLISRPLFFHSPKMFGPKCRSSEARIVCITCFVGPPKCSSMHRSLNPHFAPPYEGPPRRTVTQCGERLTSL